MNQILLNFCIRKGGGTMSESTYLIGQVLFNLLIVLTPIYFYQFIFSHSHTKRDKIIAGLAFGLASILSMSFPIVSSEGVLLDLRWIPFVICVLYMGHISGAISGLLLIVYRFSFGGMDASLNELCVIVILFISFLLIRKKYFEFNRVKKYISSMIAAGFTFSIVLAAIAVHFFYHNQLDFFYGQGLGLFLIIGVTYMVGFLIYTYFTENMIASHKLVEQVHKAEKLNIVSELAASIAHEVRNPLTVVRGFIQLSKEKVDETTQSYMDTAIRELDRAEGIVSDYLNFAKPQQNSKDEEFNLSVSIKEIILLMQSYANIKGIKLTSCIEKELFLDGDNSKFKQALLNLIKNAIEATEVGQVEVVARYSEKKDYVIIEVSDTGDGMSKDQLQAIGQPYVTTKTQGTGLGLMVTLRLIEAMGGTLTFESEVSKGTIATIKIKRKTSHQKASNMVGAILSVSGTVHGQID
jgi:two-component system, sporulation sensor kinase B